VKYPPGYEPKPGLIDPRDHSQVRRWLLIVGAGLLSWGAAIWLGWLVVTGLKAVL